MSAIKILYRTSYLLPPHATKRPPQTYYLWRSRLRQSHHFHLAVSRDNSPRCFYTSCISVGSSLTFQGCLYGKQLRQMKIVFPSRAKVSQGYTESIIKYWVLYIQGSSAVLQTNCVQSTWAIPRHLHGTRGRAGGYWWGGEGRRGTRVTTKFMLLIVP